MGFPDWFLSPAQFSCKESNDQPFIKLDDPETIAKMIVHKYTKTCFPFLFKHRHTEFNLNP